MSVGLVGRFIEWVIHNGGLYLLLFIVFAETGLFVGFFLPGDSLLFAAGIYSNDLAAELYNVHYIIIVALVAVASILGSMVGYWFGLRSGPILFERKESFLFKRKYLLRAKSFYEQYGKATVFVSKFLPIIRTFAPITAGIVKMASKEFLQYNIVGSITWVSAMMLGGHYLQTIVLKRYGLNLKDHIELIAVTMVLVTTAPVLFKLFTGAKETSKSG